MRIPKKNIKPPKIRTRYPNHLYTNGISFVSKLLGKARKITPRIAALNGSGGRENLAEGRKRWGQVGYNYSWLVVSTPLKNMTVNWDDYSKYMGKCQKWQPNHQPDSHPQIDGKVNPYLMVTYLCISLGITIMIHQTDLGVSNTRFCRKNGSFTKMILTIYLR